MKRNLENKFTYYSLFGFVIVYSWLSPYKNTDLNANTESY